MGAERQTDYHLFVENVGLWVICAQRMSCLIYLNSPNSSHGLVRGGNHDLDSVDVVRLG